MFFYYDPYFYLIIIGTLIGLGAQAMVNSTFQRYSRVHSSRGLTGAQAAQNILRTNGISNTHIDNVRGNLTDHFDPRRNVVALSDSVYNSSSISAVAVAAHECGHVIQHNKGYGMMKIRAALVPIANLGSQASIPLLMFGLLFNMTSLYKIGIIFFFFAVLFQIVTLPVEFNASKRALAALEQGGYLANDEIAGAKKVLNAAALTYVAAALVSILQLFRFIALSRRDS